MTLRSRRVVVTGMGVICAVGAEVSVFFDALVEGRSGVGLVPWRNDVVAATVDSPVEDRFSKMELNSLDRFAQFACVAASQAVKQAGLVDAEFAGPRVGLYFGSGIGGARSIEKGFADFHEQGGRVSPMTVVLTMANAAASHLSLRYRIRGPSLTYSIACASSAVAIGEGLRAIRDGYVDLAIVGGSEALLAPGMVAGWHAMRVLATPDPVSPERSCKPFSVDRTGLVLGEGAGVLILESEEHAQRRAATQLAELAGYGIASDAAHLTKPDATGQATAMRAALVDAGLEPSAIGYINAHGTATAVGDVTETQSIREVFGARGVAVSSTKALHGHLLGASGAVELIAALMALRTQIVPPTCHLANPDPRCDLDYVPNEARRGVPLDAVMSNSFAFGGTNAVLIARKAHR